MLPISLAALAFASLAAAAPAQAQDTPAALAQRALAATCANCHGPQGRAVPGAEVPGLAGQPAAYLAEQMKAFREGSRPATVMHQIAKGYTPEQVASLAAYFAAQPR